MIEVRPGGRRRIDRVLAPGFLDGLSERTLEDVRSLRLEAAQEETDLDYLLQLLQARMDIVRAERRRRAEGGKPVIEDLPAILTTESAAGEDSTTSNDARRLPRLEPSRADAHRRHVEALVADVDLSDVTALTDDKLDEVLAAYEREEESVAQRRREVDAVVTELSTEITARYRAGTASVDALLGRELLDPKADRVAEPPADDSSTGDPPARETPAGESS